MTQLKGFKSVGKEYIVFKLKRYLYSLKHSPRQWYKRFDQFMIGQRYTRSKFDNYVYFLRLHDGSFIYLLLYIDDMLIALKNVDEIEKLKTQLNQDLGEAKKILGMKITRDREEGKICLTH